MVALKWTDLNFYHLSLWTISGRLTSWELMRMYKTCIKICETNVYNMWSPTCQISLVTHTLMLVQKTTYNSVSHYVAQECIYFCVCVGNLNTIHKCFIVDNSTDAGRHGTLSPAGVETTAGKSKEGPANQLSWPDSQGHNKSWRHHFYFDGMLYKIKQIYKTKTN